MSDRIGTDADAVARWRRRSRNGCRRIFLRGADGRRPSDGARDVFQHEPALARPRVVLRVLPRDTGAGLGASHQTGWTALVAKLLQQSGDSSAQPIR